MLFRAHLLLSSSRRTLSRPALFGVIFAACLPMQAFAALPLFGPPPMPDWVREAAHQTLPEFPKTTKAVVLLSDTTYTVGPDGRAVEHVREVIKVLRPQGRDLAYPSVAYDKDQKILSFHVWSIDPAGHEYAVKDSEMADISPPGEAGQLYDDIHFKVANPPGRDPGGVIAYEYEKRMRPYLAETDWMFQDEMPHVQERFTLVLPAGYTYTTTWAHHDKIDGADLENHSYRWEMNNESAVDTEDIPLSPSDLALAARMTVHYSGPGLAVAQEGTWKGVGEWYYALARDRFAPSPEITAKAAELTAGKTDFFDKAEAIAVFMQQHIRYFVVEMGIGGNQPHPAADIFKGGYGDCKDKATLLSSMLSTVGIHSTLMLVDSRRGVVDPEDPSILGNHMIAAIEIPTGYESPRLHSVVTAKTGKRYLIFDPTWTETAFGQLENNLQGSYAVLLEGGNSEVVRLPVMPPTLNTLRRTATFKLTPDGTLRGTVVDKRFGDVSERRRVLATQHDAKQQQESMDRAAAEDFTAVTLSDLRFADAAALDKPVVTSYSMEARNFGTATGPLLMVRPRVVGSLMMPIDRKDRKVPIDLGETMLANDEYDIELPEGYVVDELPDPVKLDWGFASYESKTTADGNKLHYSRTFTLREVTLPAAKYRQLQDMVASIGADEQNRAILKRAPKAAADGGNGGGTAVAGNTASAGNTATVGNTATAVKLVTATKTTVTAGNPAH